MTKLLSLVTLIYFITGTSAIPVHDQCGGIDCPDDTKWDAGSPRVCQNDWCWDSAPESGGTGITTGTATEASTMTTKAILIQKRSIPAGAITISKTGGAKYTSISAALRDTSSNIYYIYGGNYTEAVYITRANIQLYGETTDRSTYTSNKVTISRNMPATIAGGNDASATVRISPAATNVRLYNLNIENTYGKPADQAQAVTLSALGTRFGVYGCQVRGYQDTLLANNGFQFYSKSLIQGAVDFIWGQDASAWITKSVIKTIGDGFITASGRSTNDNNWFVIDRSNVTGSGQLYLGRPWRAYARVVFQYTSLGVNVRENGWSIWTSDDPRTSNILFGEHSNTGPRASMSKRAPFATKLSSGISIETVLGSDHSWIDSAYL